MTVRAKFWVKSINHSHVTAPGEVFAEIKLAPVPSGEVTLGVTNPGAIEQFELGKKYYLDFTPAD